MKLRYKYPPSSENYMLSRERVTYYGQIASDPALQTKLKEEFCFKGVGSRTKLSPPDGVAFHWTQKGSVRKETLVEIIKHLPNKRNVFSEKDFILYSMDDYAAHLEPAVRQALYDRGYLPVILGGGITGDMQACFLHTYHLIALPFFGIANILC